jgi:hypothetical protein
MCRSFPCRTFCHLAGGREPAATEIEVTTPSMVLMVAEGEGSGPTTVKRREAEKGSLNHNHGRRGTTPSYLHHDPLRSFYFFLPCIFLYLNALCWPFLSLDLQRDWPSYRSCALGWNIYLDVYWLIFNFLVLHICIFRVLNQFGQYVVQLIKNG